jgi:gliding motility-associated-like protein
MDIYAYRGTVVLDGPCTDWNFNWGQCCRNNAVDNLATTFVDLYLEATLNNFLGNNSSPLFVSEPVRAFCIGKTHNWKQSAIELDGDSVFFSIAACRERATTCTGNDLAYAAGYTAQQPITTTPPGSMTMNAFTGLISFTPAAQEIDVMAVKATEYRYDTLFNQWVNIGSSFRDMQIVITQQCRPDVQNGVNLDFTNDPDAELDTVIGLPVKQYACLDSSVTLYFDVKIDCSTVDVTDFRLTRPDGQPIAIKALVPSCDINGEALTMDVKLYKPLSQNGDYYLYSKTGNDGNTLFNKCGFPMPENDTIVLRVDNCFNVTMDMENVTVVDDKHPRLSWSIDTAFPFPTYLFDEFRIFRSIDGGNFNYFTSVYDINTLDFDDLSATTVDANRFEYRVELGLNGVFYPPTRSITDILLRGTNVSADPAVWDSVELKWNHYDGWAGGAEYEIMLGNDDGAGGYNFQTFNAAGNPTVDSIFYADVRDLGKGFHAFKIVATDFTGGAQDISESNWFEFEIPEDPVYPPAEVVIPNVISPNNDGVNDDFIITGIGTYDERSLVIFDRWGRQVYQADGYSNNNPFRGQNNSGQDLPDGVYMYVLQLNHPPTGESDKFSGSLTISRGGL